MSKRKSSRREEVAAIVKEAKKMAVQEVAAAPEVEGAEEVESENAEPAAKATGPKLVKRKGRAPISPDGALVRVLSFLPKSLVEKIHETGRPMSRYIREVLEEKLGE